MERHSVSPLFVGVCVVLFMAVPSPASMYTLIDLGTYDSRSSYAYSVNDAGQVVGSAGQRAVLYDTTGGGNSLYLRSPGDNQHGTAWAINSSGEIVGDTFAHGATLFDPTGGGANLSLAPGGSASDISNNGHIVGWTDVSGWSHATLFVPMPDHVGVIDLGTLPGGFYISYAKSVNDSGQAVGYASATGVSRPVLFDLSGSGHNTDLGTLGGTSGNAFSINNLGHVVGVATTASGASHATLFDITGSTGNIDLGTLGGLWSSARAINDAGQIVGHAQHLTGAIHACLFDATGAGNNIDLNDFIDPASGWILTNASDINNFGWIVGFGIAPGSLPDGANRAFLLIPESTVVPLPGATLLGVLGLAYSGLRLRRMRST